jgi:hypothetical protein
MLQQVQAADAAFRQREPRQWQINHSYAYNLVYNRIPAVRNFLLFIVVTKVVIQGEHVEE